MARKKKSKFNKNIKLVIRRLKRFFKTEIKMIKDTYANTIDKLIDIFNTIKPIDEANRFANFEDPYCSTYVVIKKKKSRKKTKTKKRTKGK